MSPHRYAGVYDELLSPPRRSVEPPYGARYGPRSSVPPPLFPLMAIKTVPPLGVLPLQSDQPPGYRGRYDAPPFDDIPPGVEPPVPGFEPSPFEKSPFGTSGAIDRERQSNYRDSYRPPPYGEGTAGYRDMPISSVQNEIPVHVGDQPSRFRENYRPGHSYRDQAPVSYRDGQPFRDPASQGNYRDPSFRGGPPFRDSSFRHASFREGTFRENPSHTNFRDGNAPFRAPSADPRDPVVANYLEPNFREGYREDNSANREHMRSSYRSNIRSRGGPRRNPNVDNERHREGRDRERYNDNRDPSDKRDRDFERRSAYDKNRDGRDDRPRDYERNKDHEKERDHDKPAPDQKVRLSPKRSRETREKKRSESRARSRDRESRREKKEERVREKSSADRNRDHKDKEKKLKDRKKKKREKEKDTEKKKKRDKKEKKDKEVVKDIKKEDTVEVPDKNDVRVEKVQNKLDSEKEIIVKIEKPDTEKIIKTESCPKADLIDKPHDDLYGEDLAEVVDKEIIQNYVKSERNDASSEIKSSEIVNKEEPFDGIELQATADELDLKVELETTNQPNKEMLAPLPVLSKWEVDEDNTEKTKEPGEITSPEEDGGKVTSDVIKRAENAIFAKAINSLRPIEIKKISSDRVKLYGDEPPKATMNNIQITVPVIESEQRSIEINEKKNRYSKTPPPRLSVKERLGGKVEDIRRGRESRVVQSTVERVKSRSKTPKKEQPYRRVTVDRDRGRKQESVGKSESIKGDRRIVSEGTKSGQKHSSRSNSNNEKKEIDNNRREDKRSNMNDASRERNRGHEKIVSTDTKNIDRERKKSTIDEAHFEPDYDETVESDNETKEETGKKRERSVSPGILADSKRPKLESETIKLDLTNVKKKPDSDSESSSGSEYSSSSSSSDARKRKKKKKRSKKKKKRAASESDSESESSSDDHKKKKKKRKHKKKSTKKKKKSKHK